MSLPVLIALALAAGALLLGAASFMTAARTRREFDALHEQVGDEREEWRKALDALKRRADEAHERASQPSMPGEAALRLQGATEAVQDLRQDLTALSTALKREGEQRLATEVSLFGAIDELRASVAAAAVPAAAAPGEAQARKPRTSSLFEIVEFGDEPAAAEQ